MAKKLSKAGKVSLGLFGGLCLAGGLGTGAFFWIQHQQHQTSSSIDSNPSGGSVGPTLGPQISTDAHPTDLMIPNEFPEYLNGQRVLNNHPIQATRCFLKPLINTLAFKKQLVQYQNYVNTFDKQCLCFDQAKVQTKLRGLITQTLTNSQLCPHGVQDLEIYYQFKNTSNIEDLGYNILNIYIKWKAKLNDSLVIQPYYDLVTLTLS